EHFFLFFFFFFSSRRRHTRFSRDWSSDVCSSDLPGGRLSPSDPMLKSQPAICSAVAGAPRFGSASSGAMSSSAGAFEGSIAKPRSEERRVGKEWRSRGAADQ